MSEEEAIDALGASIDQVVNQCKLKNDALQKIVLLEKERDMWRNVHDEIHVKYKDGKLEIRELEREVQEMKSYLKARIQAAFKREDKATEDMLNFFFKNCDLTEQLKISYDKLHAVDDECDTLRDVANKDQEEINSLKALVEKRSKACVSCDKHWKHNYITLKAKLSEKITGLETIRQDENVTIKYVIELLKTL